MGHVHSGTYVSAVRVYNLVTKFAYGGCSLELVRGCGLVWSARPNGEGRLDGERRRQGRLRGAAGDQGYDRKKRGLKCEIFRRLPSRLSPLRYVKKRKLQFSRFNFYLFKWWCDCWLYKCSQLLRIIDLTSQKSQRLLKISKVTEVSIGQGLVNFSTHYPI